MGTGAPSNSKRHKNVSEDRSRKKNITIKSKKRRRHDPSSSSDYSSYPSSDSEGSRDPRARRKSSARKEDSKRAPGRRSSRDKKMLQRRKRRKEEEEEESKRQDSRSKSSKGKGRRRTRHRGRSVSSYSSRSCSTCRRRSGSPEDTGSERSDRKVRKTKPSARGRLRVREKKRSGRRSSRGRYSSPSCSSCSRCSDSRGRNSGSSHHRDVDRFAKKDHLRFPRPSSKFIKGSKEPEGRYRGGKDENRAEIIQDYDDFPSSRSNDSYEGGRKTERGMVSSVLQQHVLEEERRADAVEVVRRDGCIDKTEADEKRGELLTSVAGTVVDGGVECSDLNRSVMLKDPVKRLKSEISVHTGSPEADDSELLLRQKALENFRKFRGGLSSNTKFLGDQKDESIQNESYEVVSGKVEGTQLRQSAKPTAVSAKQKSTNYLEHSRFANDGSWHPELRPTSVAKPSSLTATVVDTTEKNDRSILHKCPNDSANSKSVHDSLISSSIPHCKEFQGTLNQLHMGLESSEKKILEEGSLGKNMPDKDNAAKSVISDIHKADVNKTDGSTYGISSSCLDPGTGGHYSNETKVDPKTASEFEQKTMSVMRGGEMVQVSYKVYIPKKTPALARRQLQR